MFKSFGLLVHELVCSISSFDENVVFLNCYI